MSKIGKRPIIIADGVHVNASGSQVEVKGSEGNLVIPLLPFVKISIQEGTVMVSVTGAHKQARANWGTMASLIQNAIQGVTKGFEKNLEIEGVGFRAMIEGKKLALSVGFTHPVHFPIPEGVQITVEKNVIRLRSVDKALIGQTAASIRKIKPPEPYKGKGIHYQGEVIRRKAGKKAATAGGKTGA